MARPTNEEIRRRNISESLSKMTEATLDKLRHVFAMDGTVEEACSYAKISVSTYYNWIRANPELLEEFDALRQNPILKARTTVISALDDPNHAFRYLERKRSSEFGMKTKVEISPAQPVGDEEMNKKAELIKEEYEEKLRKTLEESHEEVPQLKEGNETGDQQ